MWAAYKKGFAQKFQQLDCSGACVNHLDRKPINQQIGTSRSVIGTAAAARVVDKLRQEGRGVELKLVGHTSMHHAQAKRLQTRERSAGSNWHHHDRPKSTEAMKESKEGKKNTNLLSFRSTNDNAFNNYRNNMVFKVWETAHGFMMLEFLPPLTHFQAFALVITLLS